MGDPLATLRNSHFRYFLLVRLCLTLATQMQVLVIGWQVYEFTHSPFWLGMIGLTGALPFIGVVLFAGHFADIIERKKIIISAAGVLCMCGVFLWVFTLNNQIFLRKYGIAPVFALVFVSAIAKAFVTPSLFAFLSQIVPRNQYHNASAWNSTVWQAGAIGGPAAGGLLYGFAGITVTYFIALILIVLSVLMMGFIPSKPLPAKQNKESLYESVKIGIHFVFKTKEIISALSLDLFAVFFGGAVALLPMFADQVLKIGPLGYGLLRAAPSVGAVIMGAVLVYYPPLKNTGIKLLCAVFGFGICMILFALSKSPLLSFSLLALSGAFDSVSVVIRATILQVMTPDEMRGRVSAVNQIFLGSSNELGEFESGVAAKLLRLIPSVIFGGAMTLFGTAFTSAVSKSLRNLHLKEKI